MSLRSNYTPVAKVESLLDKGNNFSLKTFKTLKSVYEDTLLTHSEIKFLREIYLLKKSSQSEVYMFTLSHLYIGYALTLFKENKKSKMFFVSLDDIRNTLIDVNYDSGQYINIGMANEENVIQEVEFEKQRENSEDTKPSCGEEFEEVKLNFFERLWKSIKNMFQ